MPDTTREVLEQYGYGFGARELLNVASPAAGANASLKVSRAGAYRLLSVVCTLVTSADAANRWIELDYQTADGFVYCRNGGAPLITASTTVNVCWKIDQGMSDYASSGTDLTPICYPLADFLVTQSDVLAITVGNIDNTDQISAIAFLVEEITLGSRGYPVGRQPR